jgi:hypothetical protein
MDFIIAYAEYNRTIITNEMHIPITARYFLVVNCGLAVTKPELYDCVRQIDCPETVLVLQ